MFNASKNFSKLSYGKTYDKILFSDVGDVLISTNSFLEIQKQCLYELLSEYPKYYSFNKEVIYSMFRYYKILSQTTKTIEESINMFFKEYAPEVTYSKYKDLYDLKLTSISKSCLESGVIETLEYLDSKNVAVILLSDATDTGKELSNNLERLIVSELYEKKEFMNDFNINKYFKKYYSSKDLGVKKNNPRFVHLLFSELGLSINDISYDKFSFVGHDSDELFAMAKYGMKIYFIDPNHKNNFPKDWCRINAFRDISNIDI